VKLHISISALVELVALGLAVAAVAVATELLWATLLAGAVALGYLAHTWVDDAPTPDA
jgi:hypothetical protein